MLEKIAFVLNILVILDEPVLLCNELYFSFICLSFMGEIVFISKHKEILIGCKIRFQNAVCNNL